MMGTSCDLNGFQNNLGCLSTCQLKSRCHVHTAQNFSLFSPIFYVSDCKEVYYTRALPRSCNRGFDPQIHIGVLKSLQAATVTSLVYMFPTRWETVLPAIAEEKDLSSMFCFVNKIFDLHLSPVQLFVTLCYIVVKWSRLNLLLKYGQNWKNTIWIETVSGKHILQLMEKVQSEDMTTH